MRPGGSLPGIPARWPSLPRFPSVLVDDVPLLPVAGYELGGEAEPLAAHLDHHRKHGACAPVRWRPGR